MNENMLADVARLSDQALLARLTVLAMGERDATVEVVAHLAELDARRAHLGEGPGSVASYCREVLGYSEDAAWNRTATANVVRRFPVALGWLADGTLNVTTVRMLRPVLTADNHVAVLTEARRRSKAEVDLIVRRLAPKPDVPTTVRKLAVPAVAAPILFEAGKAVPFAESPATPTTSSSAPAPAPAGRPVIAPLTPERYVVQMTVSKETRDKLRRLQDLLCREVRNGDPAGIFDRALDALLEKVEKKKLARSRYEMKGDVRSWDREAAVRPPASSSGITCSRSATRVPRRSRTSPCDAAPTTSTRATWCSGHSTRPPRDARRKCTVFPGNTRRSRTAAPAGEPPRPHPMPGPRHG